MQDPDLWELAAKVDEHDWEIGLLRIGLDSEIRSNKAYRDAEFNRRIANIKHEIASPRPHNGGDASPEPKRHRRGVPRLRDFGWLRSMPSDDRATEDLLRRNTEAFARLVKSTDRQAERLDQANATLDRANMTLERLVESSDRHARTLNRHSEAIRDQVAELKKFGETLDERTAALTDSFAFLAKDVRASGKS